MGANRGAVPVRGNRAPRVPVSAVGNGLAIELSPLASNMRPSLSASAKVFASRLCENYGFTRIEPNMVSVAGDIGTDMPAFLWLRAACRPPLWLHFALGPHACRVTFCAIVETDPRCARSVAACISIIRACTPDGTTIGVSYASSTIGEMLSDCVQSFRCEANANEDTICNAQMDSDLRMARVMSLLSHQNQKRRDK